MVEPAATVAGPEWMQPAVYAVCNLNLHYIFYLERIVNANRWLLRLHRSSLENTPALKKESFQPSKSFAASLMVRAIPVWG
ncbi:hypothetical protein SAMN05660330_00379 [Desulforhopalus singaporensis]|uniref:Uncharacterized protein n=1 Tax=Desulforhopalus singaporensis TaxID=91360 RepID=A0A1H0JYX5_9BACT|nr:hypothetical protein SAMN05660330_00379 [Desulforhopalus singaporensis]